MDHPLRHGIVDWLVETAAHRRRLALCLLVVSVAFGGVFALTARRAARTAEDDPRRFGFEGPRQWVERIRLEERARQDAPGEFTITYLTAEARKGGERPRERSSHPNAAPRQVREIGEGDAERDLLARARMLALENPVVRSQELVIDRLVRPEYPDEARDRGIEGVVELLALVDTTGAVRQVQIVGGTREPLLEAAAARAALACRYRPYRVDERATTVWAAFRIAFTLY